MKKIVYLISVFVCRGALRRYGNRSLHHPRLPLATPPLTPLLIFPFMFSVSMTTAAASPMAALAILVRLPVAVFAGLGPVTAAITLVLLL